MDRFRATGEPARTPVGEFDVPAYIRAMTREFELLEIERHVFATPHEHA